MKRASTLLALLLALCITITAWAESGGIALGAQGNVPQAAENDGGVPELAVEGGDGIAPEPPEALPSVDLSLPEGFSLPDPEASTGVSPTDEGDSPRANATPANDFTITDDGAVTYIGRGGDVEIPKKIRGITVSALAGNAFTGNVERSGMVTSFEIS